MAPLAISHGASTGGVYAVSGTIGQLEAGPPAHAGGYMVQGGVWSVLAAVQTPGAPLLAIFRMTTNTIPGSEPSPSIGWNLQQNTHSVSSVNWNNLTSGIADDGTTKSLIVNPQRRTSFAGRSNREASTSGGKRHLRCLRDCARPVLSVRLAA